MSLRWTFIGTLLCVLTAGCDGDLSGSGPRGTSNLDIPETKRIERLNARQFFRALEVTTGQSWSRADQYAATLGQPDFDQVVQESNDISISFVKLAGDGGRAKAVEEAKKAAAARPNAARIGGKRLAFSDFLSKEKNRTAAK